MSQVGDVVKCPRDVSDTGYLKLVGHAGFIAGKKDKREIDGWLAVGYDPAGKGRMVGETFNVLEENIEEWTNQE